MNVIPVLYCQAHLIATASLPICQFSTRSAIAAISNYGNPKVVSYNFLQYQYNPGAHASNPYH